ncbi:MAG: hypothetical protein IJT94_12280 [Oscillibacter sp.]|nr:hypothetical protein [Oscillibacter sp.]
MPLPVRSGPEWGNGEDRKERLTAAGYDYTAVQKAVKALAA